MQWYITPVRADGLLRVNKFYFLVSRSSELHTVSSYVTENAIRSHYTRRDRAVNAVQSYNRDLFL